MDYNMIPEEKECKEEDLNDEDQCGEVADSENKISFTKPTFVVKGGIDESNIAKEVEEVRIDRNESISSLQKDRFIATTTDEEPNPSNNVIKQDHVPLDLGVEEFRNDAHRETENSTSAISAHTDSTGSSLTFTQQELDLQAKGNRTATGSDSVRPGAVAVTPASLECKIAALSPMLQQSPDGSQRDDTASRSSLSKHDRDLLAKGVAKRRSTNRAVQPGAVPVSPSSAMESTECAKSVGTDQSVYSSTASQDLQAKTRTGRLSNRSVRPGAVAVASSESLADANLSDSNMINDVIVSNSMKLSHEEQDARIKARASRRRTTNLGTDNNDSSITDVPITRTSIASSADKTNSTDGSCTQQFGMEELARRRQERAAIRASRRSAQSQVPNQDQDEMDDFDHHSPSLGSLENYVRSPENPHSEIVLPASISQSTDAASATAQPRSRFASMSEEERQRRFDAKMSQMEREHRERLEKQARTIEADENALVEQLPSGLNDGPTTMTSFSVPALESSTALILGQTDTTDAFTNENPYTITPYDVVAGMLDDERQRRFDAKLSHLSQSHADAVQMNPNDPADEIVTEELANSGIVSNTATSNPLNSPSIDQQLPPRQSSDFPKGHLLDGGAKRLQTGDILDPLASIERPRPSGAENDRVFSAQHGISFAPDVERGTSRDVFDNQLAVAVAIEEDDESELEKLVFVEAIEYDPNSKPPMYLNRRFRLYGCFFLILTLFVLATVSVTVSIRNKHSGPYSATGEVSYIYLTSEPTESPTNAPSNAREHVYRSFFAEVSPLVLQSGTPHFLASEWILYNDPQQLGIDDPRLLQRYMLAFWYFHTSDMGDAPWLSCNPPRPIEGELCIFKEFNRQPDLSVVYVDVPNSVRWLSSRDECEWKGVICGDGSIVVGIQLAGQGLSGTLPTELRSLPFLQLLEIHYNLFDGTVPPSYANFRHLLSFGVHGNLLSGEIPSQFYEQGSKSLITLNVGDNALSGTLDTRIGTLTNLKGLHLFGNNLSGTVPDEVVDLKYLTYTRMTGNEFTGQIPIGFSRLPQLTEFWYDSNKFTGTLPSSFGALKRMVDFRVSGNGIGGTIPPEIFKGMTQTQYIGLDSNNFSGPLPSSELLQLNALIQLRVSRNQLTGTIPTELRALESLRLVWLHLNLFTGPLPDIVCEANVPNGLNVIQVDCSPSENPPNSCRCCSACCDRTTEICLAPENNE